MILIQQNDFDVGEEYKALVADDTAAGAVVTFVGVRDFKFGPRCFGFAFRALPRHDRKILAGDCG